MNRFSDFCLSVVAGCLLAQTIMPRPAHAVERLRDFRVSSEVAAQDTIRKARSDSLTREQRELIRQANREARKLSRARIADDSATKAALNEAAAGTAFSSPEARAILERARAAREQQDSTLRSYRAMFTQRFSVGMGARKLGLEKLLFRGDNVAEISWRRDAGARVKPLGSRTTVPMASRSTGDIVDAISIPYFPGREELWFPSSDMATVKLEVDDRNMIHPLARGAERWYRYATGDSVDIRLADGRVIHLRELRITARKPEWRTFVGSFWFDRDGGQLVRAAYRMAASMDIWSTANQESEMDRAESALAAPVRDSILRATLPREAYVIDSTRRAKAAASGNSDDDVPSWVSATFRPAKANLDAITVEYALYEGKFWLPKAQSASATIDLMFARIPFRIDEKYTYDSVDGDFALAPVPPANRSKIADSVGGADRAGDRSEEGASISVGFGGERKERTREQLDSLNKARFGASMVEQCASDSVWTRVRSKYDDGLRVAYDLPCDMESLAHSSALPPEMAADEQLFDLSSQDELLKALGMSLQTPWAPQMPRLRTGSDLFRYNRVEGLSAGLELSQTLGAGFTARAIGRIGHADLHANGEISLTRTTGLRTVTASVYHSLNAVNPEWAGALSVGPSLPALLYGRDEGFYYRSIGVSLREERQQRRGALEYSLFLERQWSAGDSNVVNTFSFARLLGGRHFGLNIPAEPGSYAGARATLSRVLVEHPYGLRITGISRVEAATGTFEYLRGSLETTVSDNIGRAAVALTGSIGSSAGRLPSQRQYQLGGLRTIRGELPGTQGGDAYWFTRAELGTRQGAFRPVVFYDIGWAGSRKSFSSGRAQQGAGVGLGLLDGLLRFDIARGIFPFKGWRSDFYLEAPI